MRETGAYAWPWLSAFVRGAGTLYSATPYAGRVWVPKLRGVLDAIRVTPAPFSWVGMGTRVVFIIRATLPVTLG